MRKLLLGLTLALASMPALAADMTIKAPPIPYPAINWTGFYVGANGSYNWQRFGFPDPTVGGLMKPAGFMGGLTLGADYQMGGIVAGVVGDVQFGDIGVTVKNGNYMTETAREKTFSTIRGRIGYLVAPNFLLYGTAGMAIATVDQGENCPTGAQFGFCSPGKYTNGSPHGGPYNLVGNQTYFGGVFGAGAEWMFAPHWTTNVEYLYSNLGSANFDLGTTPTGAATSPRDISLVQQQIRFGVQYRFNGQ